MIKPPPIPIDWGAVIPVQNRTANGRDAYINQYDQCAGSGSTDVIQIGRCDSSFTWIDGVTYDSSTDIPEYIVTNSSGCDSTVTLDLTIGGVNKWIGPSSGLWNGSESFWSLNLLPDICHDVIISSGNNVFVPSQDSAFCATLLIDSTATLTVDPAAVLAVIKE